MPGQFRRFYDIPEYVKENLAVMVAEYSGITNAQMANAYYENLRDRVGILGFTYIPSADSQDRRDYLNNLNRFGSNRPITGLRILTFEAFRRWSVSPRFRNITIDNLLDEMEALASNITENPENPETHEQDMDYSDESTEEIPALSTYMIFPERSSPIISGHINYTRDPSTLPLLIVDQRSGEIINQVDVDNDNIDCVIIFPNVPSNS